MLKKIYLAFLSICIFYNLTEAPQASDKVRLTVTNPNMSFLPAGVALKKGFFKEEGLEAEVIRMSVPTTIMALSNSEIDYTLMFGSVIRAAMKGLPVKVVAALLDSSTHALIARPEFRSVYELKGRTLGIESYGATSDVAARLMLKHFSIDPDKEIKIIALGPDRARIAALKGKLVDVIVVTPPADSEAKKMGFTVLARAFELFSFPFIGLGTNVRKIKERPDEVKRVIKAMIKAHRFIREDREGAIKVLVEWGKVEPEYAAASYDSIWKVFNLDGSMPKDGLLRVIDQIKKEAKITREVPLSEVSDITSLREAQKELGIKGR